MAQQQDPGLVNRVMQMVMPAPQQQQQAVLNDPQAPVLNNIEEEPLPAGEQIIPNPQAPGTMMRVLNGQRVYNFEEQVQRAVDHLYIKCFGKIIDDRYLVYCAAMLQQLFDESHIINSSLRRRILDTAIPIHMQERGNPRFVYTPDNIDTYRLVNKNLRGSSSYRPWWAPWRVTDYSLTESLNHNPALSSPQSFRLSHLIIPALSLTAIGLTAKYVIPAACRALTNGTTIPSPEKQPTQALETVIGRLLVKNITQDILASSGNILQNSSVDLPATPGTSIADLCGQLVSKLSTWWNYKF